jgi:predicted nuclease of predicted toxin-antitoxin system
MAFAQREGRTCITLDHDFHAHLAMLRSRGPSAVFLHEEGLKPSDQASLIRLELACEGDTEKGATVSALNPDG